MSTLTKPTKRAIDIENVGPIERFSIPLPDAGVVVLRGRNGSGKSHALAAVDSLVSGRGKLPCRDGAARGLVEGCGARLTIGRSSRRKGEAEVVTLEGRLDISQLVEPPIKDEDAADRQRIKALVQLSGQAADPAAYEAVLPDHTTLGMLVTPQDKADDPVVLAGKVKRALEGEARAHEKAAEAYRQKAESIRERAGDYDRQAPPREEAEKALQDALVREREVKTTAEQVARQRANAERAANTLEQLRAKSVEDPAALETELAKVDEQIERLDKAMAVARERQQGLRRSLGEARQHQADVAQLEQTLSDVPPEISEEALQEAAEHVEAARQVHQRAAEAENARRVLAELEAVVESASGEDAAAEEFRQAAAGVDNVLSDMVAKVTTRLRVEAGRLVTDTDRGAELLAELSPGERWRIALQIAAEQVGSGGLVTVPQEAWEALDPQNRAEVAEIAAKVGVVLLTAEASDDAAIAAEVKQ